MAVCSAEKQSDVSASVLETFGKATGGSLVE
jgi:hypothetical protein